MSTLLKNKNIKNKSQETAEKMYLGHLLGKIYLTKEGMERILKFKK